MQLTKLDEIREYTYEEIMAFLGKEHSSLSDKLIKALNKLSENL